MLQRDTARPLIVLTANSCWNIVNFRRGLLDAFERLDYRLAVLAARDAYAADLAERNIPLVSLRIDSKGLSPARDLRLLASYRRELRRLDPDVMLSFTIKPNIYGSLAAASLGIAVINNISGLGTAFIRGGALERIVALLYRVALRRSTTIFFQNDDDRALFIGKKLVSAGQARLLNGSGVDLAAFAPRARSEASSGPCFLLVARLLRDKGIGEFVAAARIVRDRLPEARFQLLGPLGSDNRTAVPTEEVERWIAEGIVEYLGEHRDVRPFLAAADCVVLPSYREGLPRSLIEAAAMGCPAIATDVPGCRAAVDDGITGFLCEARSAQSLAAAMVRFAGLGAEARHAMGAAARLKAVREFDERVVADAYLDALRRVGLSAMAEGR